MILDETVNKLIRDTINVVLGVPGFAIRAEQYGAPKPTGPYASVKFVSDTELGWVQRNREDNVSDPDITETIQGMRRFMISVNFFRQGAFDNARKVRTALERESIISMFSAANVGLTDRSDVRDVDNALEDGWEGRAQFDIFLSAVGTDSDIIRSIESINISAQVQTSTPKVNNVQNFNI